MRSVASVKTLLRNKGLMTGKTMNSLLVAYGLERTVYRISVSRYAEHFTLKGGIFLYALFNGDFARATTDIDLLAERISNDTEEMGYVFSEILSLEADDPLKFDLGTLAVKPISEFKEYHGVNVSVMAYLGKTRIPVSVDIGIGDVVYPDKVKMVFPSVLDDEGPEIYAYSLCSCVAEKFEAIVSLGYDNSRFKDFYDLYVLAHSFNFDGEELKEALKETFSNRGTEMKEIIAFEPGFADDTLRQSRWKSFIRKKKALLDLTSLSDTIETIRRFIGPLVDSVGSGSSFSGQWSHERQNWITTPKTNKGETGSRLFPRSP